MNNHLFATVLTYEAPSSNYHGESENNRTVCQRIIRGDEEYTVYSAESIRNAIRETWAKNGLPVNRSRVRDANELAVSFKDYPNATKYIDDCYMGYMLALKDDTKGNEHKKKMAGRSPKRDSILRLNMAVALNPYQNEATFHQSPKMVGSEGKDCEWANSKTSALLHREVTYTAYQYPFALAVDDCLAAPKEWFFGLISAISELNNVAGNHARSYVEFCPRSVMCRVTKSRVAGYKTYGFEPDGSFSAQELSRIKTGGLPALEFWMGGEVVRNLSVEDRKALEGAGAHLFDEAVVALRAAAESAINE